MGEAMGLGQLAASITYGYLEVIDPRDVSLDREGLIVPDIDAEWEMDHPIAPCAAGEVRRGLAGYTEAGVLPSG